MTNLKHATRADLASAVSGARSECLDALRRDRETRRLWLVSRGAWVRTLDAQGESNDDACHWEFKPTAACFNRMAALRDDPTNSAVYVEGGFNGAESGQDYAAGSYDPWVGEWSVAFWVRD